MINQHIPLELIAQLRTWVSNNVSQTGTDTNAVELRKLKKLIQNFREMSLKIPEDLQRKHDELESIVNTPNMEEQFLNELAEELSTLAKDIKRRIGGNPGGTRAPGKTLRVTLPDGRVICENKAIDTFIETLQFLGLGNCARIKSVIQLGHPVVATTPNNYDGFQPGSIKEVKGFYIETKTSTDRKAEQLREYAQALGINIKVESID